MCATMMATTNTITHATTTVTTKVKNPVLLALYLLILCLLDVGYPLDVGTG